MRTNHSNPLPGVPLVESPFFAEFFDPGDDIYPVAKALHDDGFAVIDFPDPDILSVADAIRADLNDHFPWDAWQRHGGGMRVQDAWQTSDNVRRVATNAQIVDLLTRLYGRQAFPFQTLNFPVGTQQHFHTDSVHFSSRPERFMCGVWLALEDIGEGQGTLVYYPGSHKWPIYTHEHIGYTFPGGTARQDTFEPMWERLVEVNGIAPQRLTIRKGQALIWAANLLHGGDHHADRNRTRWSQVTHYYFRDCAYYTPLLSNEPAGHTMYRAPFDIGTGGSVASRYHGFDVVPEVIELSAIGPRMAADDFDAEAYLLLNRDVAEAGADPWRHFCEFGRLEGRRWR